MGIVFLEQKLVGQKVRSGGLYRLLQCASKGDKAGVIQELDKGVEPNRADYDRRIALHLAACEGWIEVVDLLLEKGAVVGMDSQAPCFEIDHNKVNMEEATRIGEVSSSVFNLPFFSFHFSYILLILASTNLFTAIIVAGCFLLALDVVLFYAKNWTLRGLSIGFIIFLALIWFLQERTTALLSYFLYRSQRTISFYHLFREKKCCLFLILEITGVMNSLFSAYVMPRSLQKFVIASAMKLDRGLYGEKLTLEALAFLAMISFIFLGASVYLGLLILA
ncbi:hypothetical protein ERO13_D04G051866v2 [Gossypium hirsutum]|nr:hypothetical protein ERO13_D04G051866v2 [Gossypium hirsutum]